MGRKTQIAIVALVALLLLGGRGRLRLRQLAEGQDRRRRDGRRRRCRRHGRSRSQAGGAPPAARAAAALAARRLRRRELDAARQEPQGPRRSRRGGRRSACRQPRRRLARVAWFATSPAATSTSRSAPTSPTPSPRSTASSARSPTQVDREAQDATVEPTADSLEVVAAKNGRKLRDNLLTRQLEGGGAERRRRPHDRRSHPLR